MDGTADFRETTLTGGLAAACWTVEVREDVADWLVLPDGAVDLVLIRGGEPLVAGPATRPSVLAQPAGARTVGLRLRPGAVVAALGVRADELRDLALPVCELPAPWRDGARRAQEELDSGAAGSAAALLLAAVGGAARASAPDLLAARAAALLAADPGLRAEAVAGRLGVSPRHLRRRFAEQVGYGPRRYARIMRLQRLLALRARHPDASVGRLAADAGYADHSHLVRECRELAGRTPTALLAQRSAVSLSAP